MYVPISFIIAKTEKLRGFARRWEVNESTATVVRMILRSLLAERNVAPEEAPEEEGTA